HLSDALRIGALLLLFNTLAGAETGTLMGLERFRSIARVNLIRSVLALPMTVAGVLLWGVKGVVGATVVSSAMGWLLARREARVQCRVQNIKVSYGGSLRECRVLFTFSLPAVLGSLSTAPTLWLANTMLVNQANGYAQLGILNAAQQIKRAV